MLIRRDAIRRRVPIYRGVLRMADEQLRRGVVFAQPGGCEPEVVEEGRPRSRCRRWRNRCCCSWFRVATIDTEFERVTAIEILHEHSQPNQSVGPIPAHMLRSIMFDHVRSCSIMLDHARSCSIMFDKDVGALGDARCDVRDRCLVLRAASAVQPMPIMAPRWSTASTATTSTTTFPP